MYFYSNNRGVLGKSISQEAFFEEFGIKSEWINVFSDMEDHFQIMYMVLGENIFIIRIMLSIMQAILKIRRSCIVRIRRNNMRKLSGKKTKDIISWKRKQEAALLFG